LLKINRCLMLAQVAETLAVSNNIKVSLGGLLQFILLAITKSEKKEYAANNPEW
jgi:flagellar biosynthesis protein FliR